MYRIGRVRLYASIIATIILEIAFLNLVSIGNIRPNLMLILVIFIGLHSDWKESLEAGIAGGILRDVITSGSAGINLIIFGLCGLFAAYCKNKVYKENFLTQIILTLLMAVAVNILGLFSKIVIVNAEVVGIGLWHTVLFPVVLVSLYTSFFAPPAFFCLSKLLRVRELRF